MTTDVEFNHQSFNSISNIDKVTNSFYRSQATFLIVISSAAVQHAMYNLILYPSCKPVNVFCSSFFKLIDIPKTLKLL